MTDEVLNAVQQLKPIAAQANITLAQLAIAWTLNRPGISAAIIGASRPEQVSENVVAAGVTLAPEIIDAIDAALGSIVVTDSALTSSPNPRP